MKIKKIPAGSCSKETSPQQAARAPETAAVVQSSCRRLRLLPHAPELEAPVFDTLRQLNHNLILVLNIREEFSHTVQ